MARVFENYELLKPGEHYSFLATWKHLSGYLAIVARSWCQHAERSACIRRARYLAPIKLFQQVRSLQNATFCWSCRQTLVEYRHM